VPPLSQETDSNTATQCPLVTSVTYNQTNHPPKDRIERKQITRPRCKPKESITAKH